MSNACKKLCTVAAAAAAAVASAETP
jgi:hypothetical protein